MRRIRVIPTLLMDDGRLVKSVKFLNHKYVGDPINAVKIFNEKEVDELLILDISASRERRSPDVKFLSDIASEAFMPLGYGGGLTTIEQIKEIVSIGFEKVILNTSAFYDIELVSTAARRMGSQSIVVSIDVKKNIWNRRKVFIHNGSRNTNISPIEYAKLMEQAGAGELLINSIDNDGTFNGYDTELIREISSNVKIPVVAVGGAGSIADFLEAVKNGASAAAAGSMFVFRRPHRAVLISYPDQKELEEGLFRQVD